MKLPHSYYLNPDVLYLAKDLLGKVLYTQINGQITAGIITETEAYAGISDKASHAYGGRRTQRIAPMYQDGGISYVYLCYGIHCLFNVVTGAAGEPNAVLIRSVEPYLGLEAIASRRAMPVTKPAISAGPGSAAKALGIDLSGNNLDLTGDTIWIEDHHIKFEANAVAATPRVGVAYAGDHALLPWRYFVRGSKFVSKPNKTDDPLYGV